MFDILITGALVADGTGRELFRADAGIVDGRIARIGADLGEAARVIDGTGKVLSPGFIDMHTHMDLELLRDRKPTPRSARESPRISWARTDWERRRFRRPTGNSLPTSSRD